MTNTLYRRTVRDMLENMQTASAQATAIEFGALMPLLTAQERRDLVDFLTPLRAIDPRMADLFVQHLKCIGDCLRDCVKERDKAYGLNIILSFAVIAAFLIGLAA